MARLSLPAMASTYEQFREAVPRRRLNDGV
jgi:hypothetical protein